MTQQRLTALHQEMIDCRACPRLVAHREEVSRNKRRAYRDEEYWGKPVPGFGDSKARVLIVGLAPGAHGANRTGRMFTGDKSGEFLYSALFRAGWANQPQSLHRQDGLVLHDVYIVAPVRCVPPDNKPSKEEFCRCFRWFTAEASHIRAQTYLALGALAWNSTLDALASFGESLPHPRPPFAHGAEQELSQGKRLFGSYHVSQQNTQTGKLTAKMFDDLLLRIKKSLIVCG